MPLNRTAALGAEVIELQQPFAAIGLEELLSRKFPPKEMLLAPWLPFKGVAMVFAPRGAGKTHFALGVAYAVASGGAYLGWHAPRPRKVLVIDGEMPAAALQERWMEIVAKNLKEPPSGDFIRILASDLSEFGLPDLSTQQGQDANRRNEAVARMTMGSGLSAWAVMAALDGTISAGPPSDSREAAALRNSGWQPYSIKIGDRWVSYQRFEPISLLAGVAADFATLGKYATTDEADSIALGMSMAVAKNLTSKTWLSGLSDFMEVLSDSERYGERWVQRMAGSMAVPAVVAHAAGSMDPYGRHLIGEHDHLIINRVVSPRFNPDGSMLLYADWPENQK